MKKKKEIIRKHEELKNLQSEYVKYRDTAVDKYQAEDYQHMLTRIINKTLALEWVLNKRENI